MKFSASIEVTFAVNAGNSLLSLTLWFVNYSRAICHNSHVHSQMRCVDFFLSCANVSYPAAKTIKQLDFYASHSTSTSHSSRRRLEGTECLHLENFCHPIQDKTIVSKKSGKILFLLVLMPCGVFSWNYCCNDEEREGKGWDLQMKF